MILSFISKVPNLAPRGRQSLVLLSYQKLKEKSPTNVSLSLTKNVPSPR